MKLPLTHHREHGMMIVRDADGEYVNLTLNAEQFCLAVNCHDGLVAALRAWTGLLDEMEKRDLEFQGPLSMGCSAGILTRKAMRGL